MIVLAELNPHKYPTTPEIDHNLNTLLTAINVIRAEWGKPMTVTSGLRSEADQQRINPKATHSKHLIGAAVDIADPDGTLYAWTRAHPELLEKANLYCELGVRGWVHYQCLPFGSYKPGGNRWFNP